MGGRDEFVDEEEQFVYSNEEGFATEALALHRIVLVHLNPLEQQLEVSGHQILASYLQKKDSSEIEKFKPTKAKRKHNMCLLCCPKDESAVTTVCVVPL